MMDKYLLLNILNYNIRSDIHTHTYMFIHGVTYTKGEK